MFATWALNNTPLVNDDAIDYLIGITNIDKRREVAGRLRRQIEEQHLTNKWLDEAVQFVNLENIAQARQYARIMYDVGIANKISKDVGWGFYVEALCQNQMGNIEKADSLLNNSRGYFEKANDQEGMIWIKNTKAQFKQNPTPMLSVQTGHLLPYSLALSPNPRYFATGSDDFTIKIWDIQLVREIKTIKAHDDVVNCINYSPGGRYIVSSSEDNTIKVWNAYDYSLVQTIKVAKNAQLVMFTPDGGRLVCGTRDSTLTIFDPISGKQLFKSAKLKARISDIVFNPQNPKLMAVSSRDSTIKFWNLDSLKAQDSANMGGFAFSLKWSNDGNYIAAFCSDTLLRVLNCSTWKWQYYYKINCLKVGNGTYMSSGSFSPDSKYLVFPGKKGKVIIADLVKKQKTTYNNSSDLLGNINFAANGSYFIEDYFYGEPIRMIDFNQDGTSALPANLTSTEFKSFVEMPVGLKFGNDSKSLYVLTLNLKKFDFLNGSTELVTDAFQVNNNCGNHLVLTNNDITTYVKQEPPAVVVFDYKNKRELKNLPLPTGKITTFSFAANDSLCFIGNDKRTVTAYNVKSGKIIFSKGYHAANDTSVKSIIPDLYHTRLYVKIQSDQILVVDMKTGELRDSISLPEQFGLAVTNKYLFATGKGGYIYKYSADDYKLLKKIPIASRAKVWGL